MPFSYLVDKLFGAKFKGEDLFNLVSSVGLLGSFQEWYFCPKQFSPDGDFKASKEGTKLKVAIFQLAPHLGYIYALTVCQTTTTTS
jgi:hypothetical protein